VDGILERLGTEYLDFLILHRPDVLVEPEEVAEAFTKLRAEGKVKHFGVSNQNRFQMELLQSYLDEPLAVNQLQLSPAHTPMF
ncbi:aldo/keto reductase, partial [Streptococcus suis]